MLTYYTALKYNFTSSLLVHNNTCQHVILRLVHPTLQRNNAPSLLVHNNTWQHVMLKEYTPQYSVTMPLLC